MAASASAADPQPAAVQKVDFHKDIAPILNSRCVKCHGNGQHKGGLSIDSRQSLMAGGESGPVVVVGHSDQSELIERVVGDDPDTVMPAQGPRLTNQQISLLRAWIDQGLAWEIGFTFRKFPIAPLAPRRPQLPKTASKSLANPVDQLLEPYFGSRSIKPGAVADDQTYIRRVYLDVIGVLPTPEDVAGFVADKQPDKRQRLARRVLSDNTRYAEHWLSFWNDALRNDYRGTGYIDGGRREITPWLYSALLENMPYDRFVKELISPTPHSEGFINGIVWRGVVNASQVPPMQAAQNISQVFMGINLKCASCHDSFISQWKLSDAYGLAGVFAEDKLEMHRCDKPIGSFATMKFLYPELGGIDSAAPRRERLAQLAANIVRGENGRLTRTIVNRIWARLLGHGLIEPVDEMDNPPWNQDLLDWLASDLVDHGYNLKHTMQQILTSRAYQLPSAGMQEQGRQDFIFRGPVVRRMSAEQFVDAVSLLCGVPYAAPAVHIPTVATRNAASRAKWIWKDAAAAQGADGGRIFLRKVVDLTEVPHEALLVATCDNQFTLWINGHKALSGERWQKFQSASVRHLLHRGANVIAVEAINWPDRQSGSGASFTSPNPAGFLLYGKLRHRTIVDGDQIREKDSDIGSDKTWKWSNKAEEGWQQVAFSAEGWQSAVEVGGTADGPWKLETPLVKAILSATALQSGRPTRASLANNDQLLAALGRPNREQVVMERPKVATTLQALELTNGNTLARLMKRGADKWRRTTAAEPRGLVERMYNQALGRPPSASESAAALELIGTPPSEQGVEDLLWVMVMLPEFQLIY